MPRKRGFQEFDPTKSDSEDEDFDVTAQRSRSTRSTRNTQKPRRKKRKANKRSSDEDEDLDSEESEDSEASYGEEEVIEEPEVDPRTGRPVRRNRKTRPTYEESDGDSIDYMNEINGDDNEEPVNKQLKRGKKPKVMVNLRYNPKRGVRSKSNSVSSKRAGSENTGPVRKSSRIAQGDDDDLYELTNSGNHVAVTGRDRTKSPEMLNLRPTRGGKGLRKPPILDIPEESFDQPKIEPNDGQEPVQAHETGIPASREEVTEAVIVADPGMRK